MMRSLYSAVSGLREHQTKMDVIGNNIANVNTVGFKKGRTSFKDMLSQTIQGASAPGNTQGGTNPMQVGLGVTLGAIDTLMTQGSAETTGKNTDLMIQGDGMFVLNLGGNEVYSRTGSFDTDAQGNLVDLNTGAFVQGNRFDNDTTLNGTLSAIKLLKGDNYTDYTTTPPTTYPNLTLSSFSIDQNGVITGIYQDSTTNTSVAHKIAQIAIANFSNTGGLTKLGNNLYAASNNSGPAAIGAAGTGGRGSIITGALEMSNVDLSEEFTDMITAQRGFQANARVITVSDTLLQELIDLKRS